MVRPQQQQLERPELCSTTQQCRTATAPRRPTVALLQSVAQPGTLAKPARLGHRRQRCQRWRPCRSRRLVGLWRVSCHKCLHSRSLICPDKWRLDMQASKPREQHHHSSSRRLRPRVQPTQPGAAPVCACSLRLPAALRCQLPAALACAAVCGLPWDARPTSARRCRSAAVRATSARGLAASAIRAASSAAWAVLAGAATLGQRAAAGARWLRALFLISCN